MAVMVARHVDQAIARVEHAIAAAPPALIIDVGFEPAAPCFIWQPPLAVAEAIAADGPPRQHVAQVTF